MRTYLCRTLRVLPILLAVLAIPGWAIAVQPQQVTTVYPTLRPVVYTVQYDPIPVSYWHWTPQLGWHVHTYYQYVPHWTPSPLVAGPTPANTFQQ